MLLKTFELLARGAWRGCVMASACAGMSVAQEPGGEAKSAPRALEVHAVSVDGRPVSWPVGGRLRTKPAPGTVMLNFGAPPTLGWKPFRMRYKLEGWDHDWQMGGGFMFITVRFCNEAGDKIAQQEFDVSDQSAGWNGSLQASPLAHRRETLVVPPQATRLWLVISSGGPPATVGIYVVDHLVVSRLSPTGAPAEVLLRTPFKREPGGDPTEPQDAALDGWQRDGTRPSMARIIELGQNPKVEALGIMDEDSAGHAEWHNRRERAPRIEPGEQLMLEWNELYSIGVADLQRVGYERLPPGDFRFRVAEVTALGLPTGIETALAIRVPRELWRTEWFWFVASVLLIAAAAAGSRYYATARMRRVVARLEYQRMMEGERLRIAQDIHDDLGARVTQISLFSAMAQANPALPEKARADFERISRMSRELVASLYETVWAVDPENDNLESLGDYLCQVTAQLCEAAQMRCRFEMQALPRTVQISSHVRHSLTMAVKEAVHNVIKHAGASEVTVGVKLSGAELEVSIADDGCGLHGVEIGNGLPNMKRRLQDLGGVCVIESAPGRGTVVRLRLKVAAPAEIAPPSAPETAATHGAEFKAL